MPIRPTKGTKQTNLELPIDVVDAARAFAKSRGETLGEVIVTALKRHMANPPPLPADLPLPPLAPSPAASEQEKKPQAKKSKK